MSFNCTCPYCKQLLQCEDAWAGMTAQCPTCGQNIVMNPPPAAPPPPLQTVQFSPFAGARPERASGGKILSVYLFMPLLLLFSPLSLILLIYLVYDG